MEMKTQVNIAALAPVIAATMFNCSIGDFTTPFSLLNASESFNL